MNESETILLKWYFWDLCSVLQTKYLEIDNIWPCSFEIHVLNACLLSELIVKEMNVICKRIAGLGKHVSWHVIFIHNLCLSLFILSSIDNEKRHKFSTLRFYRYLLEHKKSNNLWTTVLNLLVISNIISDCIVLF